MRIEKRSPRFSGFSQLPESLPDAKSRLWPAYVPPVSGAELVCPEPRRATNTPFLFDNVNIFDPKSREGNHCMELLGIHFNKDEYEGDSDTNKQKSFFCGSPPIRTHNPVIHDAEFAKLTQLSSPLGNSHGSNPARSDKGSPSSSCSSSRGSKPKVRIEGFACGNPKSSRVVPAFA